MRVESYLRAHHLESRVLLNELAHGIILEARQRAVEMPGEPPVEVAMRVTHEKIGAWFEKAGQAGDWSNERVRAHGRLALVIADLPGRWSHQFLSSDPVPPELAAALSSATLRPGPELRFSNMPPAPLKFGFDDSGGPDSKARGGWMLVRAAGWWVGAVGLFGVAWAASH
mgnify:FL=1